MKISWEKKDGLAFGVVLGWSWVEHMERKVIGSISIYDNPTTKYSG